MDKKRKPERKKKKKQNCLFTVLNDCAGYMTMAMRLFKVSEISNQGDAVKADVYNFEGL